MTNHPNRGRHARPLSLLNEVAGDYPNAWQQIETLRTGKGVDLPNWPDWCFLPMAGWYLIVSAELQVDKISLSMISDVSRLAALGAWRYTQGIYRIDSDVFDSLVTTVPRGALPADVFYRMPEWSVYIETTGQNWMGETLNGFFAHLEKDINTGRDELRLLLDCDQRLVSVPVHLGPWTITEAIDRSVTESSKQSDIAGFDFSAPDDYVEVMSRALCALISLLLYVISNGVDYPDDDRPTRAAPKRTKKGWRLFPAAKPRIWRLGEKTGDAIRHARDVRAVDRKGPSPHIRRAHWHGFWSGPRDGDRNFNLQWLPPIVVASDDENG